MGSASKEKLKANAKKVHLSKNEILNILQLLTRTKTRGLRFQADCAALNLKGLRRSTNGNYTNHLDRFATVEHGQLQILDRINGLTNSTLKD